LEVNKERVILRRFLIVGQTGVGKSSFINSVFGVAKARTCAFEACTKIVEYFAYKTRFGDIHLIDTPGLSEDTIDIDVAYLRLVHDALVHNPINVTLYVTRLDDTRFRPGEKRALQLLTAHLGSSLWQHSWLVLTFAASVPLQRLDEITKVKAEQISSYLRELTRSTGQGMFFDHFVHLLLIDNCVSGWHPDAVPVSSILEKGI
jgi:GTPase Era involved in 16S rRNA processing